MARLVTRLKRCDKYERCACVTQDLSNVELFSPSVQPLHPVIYATAAVLLLCLLAIMVTYTYHHRYPRLGSTLHPLRTSSGNAPFCVCDSRSVRVSRKFWHMLLNLCFHVSLTFGVFAGGINQTGLASVCQAVSKTFRASLS